MSMKSILLMLKSLAFWHYKQDKYNLWEFESKQVFIIQHFSFNDLLKFHAQLSMETVL